MSENLNRSNPDFSKYDSMSIGELEEILRADTQGPERDDSDVDEILYVMEVLAKKRRQNGIAGKTALEAYQEFQQHYLPMVEEESKPQRKSNVIPFRRIAAVAASLVLIFTLTTSVNAFGWKDIWNAVARWAEETFSFSMGVDVSEPMREEELQYSSLQEALLEYKQSIDVPTWVPQRYDLLDIKISHSPAQSIFVAIYVDGEDMLKISVKSYLETEPEHIEYSEGFSELYQSDGTDYYIFYNHDQYRAAWLVGSYECYISGKLTADELKLVIDSIDRG